MIITDTCGDHIKVQFTPFNVQNPKNAAPIHQIYDKRIALPEELFDIKHTKLMI